MSMATHKHTLTPADVRLLMLLALSETPRASPLVTSILEWRNAHPPENLTARARVP